MEKKKINDKFFWATSSLMSLNQGNELRSITRKKKKKRRKTASLRVAHDAKFPSFFPDDSSITKQTK
jgi:hypothetical protein